MASYPAQPPNTPTPSSEIIHLVSTFGDTLDSLPPTLTRSLSDLKELDAVLSGSLSSITTKLQLLLTMMNPPPPGSPEAEAAPKYTPYERLKLLRELTEDARVFRLGGEDKIRVATSTCETIATHTSHLSTLSNLLLTFLPAHLLPHLPPPCAPHGYPSSNTPASAIARRQMFDYPPSRHPGQGSTSRMQGALGLVREHWDLTRSRERLPGTGSSKKRSGMLGGSGTGDEREEKKKSTNSDPLLRHPNQHTKKRIQAAQAAAAAAAAAAGGGGSGHIHMGGGGGAVPATATNLAAGVYATVGVTHHNHPMGMTAVEAVKAKRSNGGAEQYGGSSQGSVVGQPGSVASRIAGGVPGVGQVGGNAGGLVYHAVQDDYGMNRMSSKRKVEDSSAARKRTKKGPEHSPDPTPRTIPVGASAFPSSALLNASKPPRRTTSKTDANDMMLDGTELPPLMDDELEGIEAGEEGDEGDKTIYCFCQRVSFGEMIGCDGNDCEREWFHLSCVGLQAIPKGRWFCDDCRRANEKGGKKRGR